MIALKQKSSESGKPGARNACKLCAPLGAAMVFCGVQGCIPFLHGSQGCATYIRRYMISHFREPVDIASSSFTEEDAVFGGARNLKLGLENVRVQYAPDCIGVATTCLSETIGEDVAAALREYREECPDPAQGSLVHVSTASYRGSHCDGFHATCRALVEQFAAREKHGNSINIFPGMVSPADLRYLKEVMRDFEADFTLLPDYSDTLDGISWEDYQRIQPGGTPPADIRQCGSALGSLECGRSLDSSSETAGAYLEKRFAVRRHRLGMPIGIRETDRFFNTLEGLCGRTTPEKHRKERGRLVDSLVDGHKYLFGKKALVIGDPDIVIGIASFLSEIGVVPVLCATGSRTGTFKSSIADVTHSTQGNVSAVEGIDYATLGEQVGALEPDVILGSSKSYPLARKLGIPLIRVGFPIHDRIGGQRVLHLGYRGAQQLFDLLVNTLLEQRQDESKVGYSYL